MNHPISPTTLALILSATLVSTSCGDSKDKRKSSEPSKSSLLPADFQNKVSPEDFQQKNQEAQRLLQSIEQQFGMKTQDSRPNGSVLILTQAALQAFVGAKADKHLLNKSLEVDVSMALITRLITEDKPSSCTVVLSTFEALYSSLAIAAQESFNSSQPDQMQKAAEKFGMDLEQEPVSDAAALSFKLTGTTQWPGFNMNQNLDVSAGANDRYVFVKRDAKLATTLTRPGQEENPDAAFGHYTYASTGGLSADLALKQVVILDNRKADFDMIRNGEGIRGSSQLDLQNRVQGGDLPSMTTELNISLQGEGMRDEGNVALYNEQRRFTSELVKVDPNTLRLSLALNTQGGEEAKNLTVEWLLQKNAEGECKVTHQGH